VESYDFHLSEKSVRFYIFLACKQGSEYFEVVATEVATFTETHIDSTENVLIAFIDQLHVTSPIVWSNNSSKLLEQVAIIIILWG